MKRQPRGIGVALVLLGIALTPLVMVAVVALGCFFGARV